MGWLWFDTELENRVDDYTEKAQKRANKYKDTYKKAKDAVEFGESLAEYEGDPEETLEVLREGLSLARNFTGAVPLMSEFLTLYSHAANAAIEVIEVEKEALYQAYRERREMGLPHEGAITKPIYAEEFRLRYELEQLRDEAQDIEVPEDSCDTCAKDRTVDKLYECRSCGGRVCNHCNWHCNQDGDDGRYCKDCRTECTHHGLQYCTDHLTACPVDGKPYCESYIAECPVDGETRCLAHLVPCEGCDDLFCDDCFNPYIEAWELAA